MDAGTTWGSVSWPRTLWQADLLISRRPSQPHEPQPRFQTNVNLMLTLLRKLTLQQLIERENASWFLLFWLWVYTLTLYQISRARGTYHGTVHLEPCLLSASSWILRMRSAWIWYKVLPLGSPTLYIPLGYWTPRRVPWPPAKSRTPTQFSEISSSPVIGGGKKAKMTRSTYKGIVYLYNWYFL